MSAKLAYLVARFLFEVLAWVVAVTIVNVVAALAKGTYKIVRNKVASFRKTELAPAK